MLASWLARKLMDLRVETLSPPEPAACSPAGLGGWLAGQKVNGLKGRNPAPTRNLQPGAQQAWEAGWLARKLTDLRAKALPPLETCSLELAWEAGWLAGWPES